MAELPLNKFIADVGNGLYGLQVKAKGTLVEDYIEGSSNITKSYPTMMSGVSVSNDGEQNLTFTINGITRTLYPTEIYNGTLKPFNQIEIKATDKYRVEVMS
jgi:hypothetical protein